MEKRKCKKCLIEWPITEFRDRPKKLTYTCKECERRYQRDWYKRNQEKCRERVNESQKKARRDPARRDALLEKQREHYHRKGKHTAKIYFEKMKDEQPWRWRAKNLSRNISKEITEEWLINEYEKQNGLCALSGRKLDVMTFHVDHIKPKKLNGSNGLENLRLVSPEANMAKSDLTDSDLIQLCKDILKTQIPELIGRAIMEIEK